MVEVPLTAVVVFVAEIEALGAAEAVCEKNPPRARYSVLASITVMATKRIVAIIGDTPLSFL